MKENRHLGIDIQGDIAKITLFSHNAEAVTVGLFDLEGNLTQEVPLERSEDFWRADISTYPKEGTYAFRVKGGKKPDFFPQEDTWLADPYARALQSPTKWGESPNPTSVRAYIGPRSRPFEWEGTSSPNIALKNLLIYEMHVRGFTRHPSSGSSFPGTFQAVIDKIPHLKKLGVNAVELMPIFEFDETHGRRRKDLCNYWGYNPLHFFSPMRRFSANAKDPFGPIDECKKMVRELHKNGIEVLLDVVYNHSGEGKELDYQIHFRGIDHAVYYMLDPQGTLRDYTGCGNTLNVNQPIVQRLILDSLRYWIEEFHIDGFRFDLAAIFSRNTNGVSLNHSPILEAIASDPVISKKKIIAEVWDAAGLYLSNYFAQPHGWSEWNGRYRDHVRRFLKGTNAETARFADSICGSQYIYNTSHTPLSSVNFITAHDGFTLRDLVSYNQKHNESNGENNQDGNNVNDSWNCGIEGATDDPAILKLRERQMRNFLVALFLSQGIPMLCMRDEYGHSCNGNNNPYVHDNELNWYRWNEREDIVHFVADLISFRKKHSDLFKDRFLKDTDIQWHGIDPSKPDFSAQSHFIAFSFLSSPIYVAFNASAKQLQVQLPEKSPWRAVIQTEKDWSDQGFEHPVSLCPIFEMVPYSALVAIGAF